MISVLEDDKARTADLFVKSDQADVCQGTREWNITDLRGNSLDTGKFDATISAWASHKIKTLDLAAL